MDPVGDVQQNNALGNANENISVAENSGQIIYSYPSVSIKVFEDFSVNNNTEVIKDGIHNSKYSLSETPHKRKKIEEKKFSCATCFESYVKN